MSAGKFSLYLLVGITLLVAVPARSQPDPVTFAGPDVVTSDIDRFFQVYDAAQGHPSAESLQRDYITPGTQALHEFAEKRQITGENLAKAIADQPDKFVRARQCTTVLQGVRTRLTEVFDKLLSLYPEARFPPVVFVIGRGKTGGTTSSSGVIVGLETIGSVDWMDPDLESRFTRLIAHEYAHVQQPGAEVEDSKPTVLYASLIEGGAEFIGELTSGEITNFHLKTWTKGKELAIETAFLADAEKMDLSRWLWNGPGTPEKPADLGYWIGYRITKSYYQRSTDKRQAIRDILEMKDPKGFLAASGWSPGSTEKAEALPSSAQLSK